LVAGGCGEDCAVAPADSIVRISYSTCSPSNTVALLQWALPVLHHSRYSSQVAETSAIELRSRASTAHSLPSAP
jgi:hypothetical protein